MSNQDKRTVHTDALDTLGTVISTNEKRDAIHIAVEPVVAGEILGPGDHVRVTDGIATKTMLNTGVGIVDPYLIHPVHKGERFWLLIYPRQIKSLRHVWSHPAFPDEQEKNTKSQDKVVSEAWLRRFCEDGNAPSYEILIESLSNGATNDYDVASSNDGEYLHVSGWDASGDIPDEFWDHIEVVLGKSFPRAKYFSCSC